MSFFKRIDLFKEPVIDKSTASKFGGFLSSLVPMVVIAYTTYLAVTYNQNKYETTTEMNSNINTPVQVELQCWAPKCFMSSNYLQGHEIVSACYNLGRINPCRSYTIGQVMTGYICYSPDPNDGLRLMYQDASNASDTRACPNNPSCRASGWTYPSTSFGASLNSITYDEKRARSAMQLFPLSEGQQLLTQITYNLSALNDQVYNAFFPTRVYMEPSFNTSGKPNNPCSSLPDWPMGQSISYVALSAQPTYITRTIAIKSYADIFGQIGGIGSAAMSVFGLILSAYKLISNKLLSKCQTTKVRPTPSNDLKSGEKDAESGKQDLLFDTPSGKDNAGAAPDHPFASAAAEEEMKVSSFYDSSTRDEVTALKREFASMRAELQELRQRKPVAAAAEVAESS